MSYVKAVAKLENLQRLRRIGRADDNEIQQLEQVIRAYNYSSAAVVSVVMAVPQGYEIFEPERVLSQDAVELITKLQGEAKAIDNEKNKLANSLYYIADTVNCKDIVQKIKYLREQWRIKGDEIRYVKKHGKLPGNNSESDSEFLKKLPTNLLELDRKLRYRKTDLSKYKQRFAVAKTETEKAKQERNIAQAEIEISLMQTQINTLK